MSREDVLEEIMKRSRSPGSNQIEKDDGHTVESAMQKLVCVSCGSQNGVEPRPLNVPDIKTECPECDDFTRHEYRVVGERDG